MATNESNELVVNEPRIGWYYDGLPDDVTPPTSTMLLDNGRSITLTIPWREDRPTAQLERWFAGHSVHFGDDPDRTLYSYQVPNELLFVDVDGPISLVGCLAGGYRRSYGWDVGQGTVVVQAAVLGTGRMGYESVHGVRSVIPELAEWMGFTSVDEADQRDADGRLTRLDLELQAPAKIPLSPRLNFHAVPTWRIERDPYGPSRLHDETYLETIASKPRGWVEHLDLHQSVRELIDISAWEPFGYRRLTVHRADDPHRVMSGEAVDDRWCDVRTYALRHARSASSRPRYWYGFEDIGVTGFRRWLRLRSKYERAVVPLLTLLDVPPANVETRLMQSSVGLEALGYQIAVESGVSQPSANRLSFGDRLELIRSSLPVATVGSDWPARAADAYNGFKHANRVMPDRLSMSNTVRENVLAFRMWASKELGVSAEKLAGALTIDRGALALRQYGLAPGSL
jgi:hypothetical protein